MDNIEVAVIDLNLCDIGWKEDIENMPDSEFIELAKKTERIYSLREFQLAWNADELGYNTYIRFLNKYSQVS